MFSPLLLTEKEHEILRFVAAGFKDKEIACKMYLSPRTVNSHMRDIFGKLGVHSRAQAVVMALKYGLIRLEEISE